MSDNFEPKKRGRKPGFTTGPRPTFYVVSALIDDQIVTEKIFSPSGVTMTKEEVLSFNENDAEAAFIEKHGVEPESITGPCYEVKGVQVKTTRKRDTINIPTSDLKLSLTRKEAIFKGWKGFAIGIEGRNDVMYFMADKEVTPSTDPKKKLAPKACPVMISALQFVDNQAQA